MQGAPLPCIWPWLSEFSGVVLNCLTLSGAIIFTDVSLIQLEDSFNPLFKTGLYSHASGDLNTENNNQKQIFIVIRQET